MIRRLVLCLAMAFCVPAHALDTSAGQVTVTRMIAGLTQPWALGFLPDGGVLVTERGGRLLLHRDGTTQAAPARWRGHGGGPRPAVR